MNWHEGDDYWEKIVIFKKYHNNDVIGLCIEGYGNTFKNGELVFHEEVPYFSKTWTSTLQPATKEQRDFLFQKIKEASYEWNEKTKTLEKLTEPKFKVGSRIKNKINHIATIIKFKDDYYYYKDKNGYGMFHISGQDQWELALNKFDISTLKPFESRVLVRDKNADEWRGQFFSHYDNNSDRPYICIGIEGICEYKQCIPFENNEYLLGTTNYCEEFYKNWE